MNTDTTLNWFDEHDNMVLLTRYLADNGHSGDNVAYAVEKPWKYEAEYKLARMQWTMGSAQCCLPVGFLGQDGMCSRFAGHDGSCHGESA